MRIFDYLDHRRFLNDLIASQPKKGRGQAAAMADLLNVSRSAITLILKHDRALLPEQALKLAEFYGFEPRETEYFLELVNHDRADSKELRAYYLQKLKLLRDAQIKERPFNPDQQVSGEHVGIYFSNWYYAAAIHLMAIPEFQTTEALAERLGLSRQKMAKIINFLLSAGLCVQDKNGRLKNAQMAVAIDSSSEFLNSHRRNWREKAREKFNSNLEKPTDYFMSASMSLSEKHAEQFHEELRLLVKRFAEFLKDSPDETVRCLNIDWFEF